MRWQFSQNTGGTMHQRRTAQSPIGFAKLSSGGRIVAAGSHAQCVTKGPCGRGSVVAKGASGRPFMLPLTL